MRIQTYTSALKNTYLHEHAQTHTNIHTNTYTHPTTQTHKHTDTPVHTPINTHTHMNMHKPTKTFKTYSNTHTHAHTLIHKHTKTHTNAHIHYEVVKSNLCTVAFHQRPRSVWNAKTKLILLEGTVWKAFLLPLSNAVKNLYQKSSLLGSIIELLLMSSFL